MNELHIGSLLIINGDKMLGMITERDILYKGIIQQKNLNSIAVNDIMTTDPVTVSPETSVAEAIATITLKRVRHLPVVAEGKVLGLVSIGDMAKHGRSNYEMQRL